MHRVLEDIRAAWRRILRRPREAALWCGTLALALGIASGVFGLVDAVLLRPLPFPHGQRLVRLYMAFPSSGLTDISLSAGELVDVQHRMHDLVAVGGYIPDSYTLTGHDQPVRLTGAWATPGLFKALGVAPALGRGFLTSDRQPDAPPLVLLSHRLWRMRFAADPGVLGQTIELDGRERTVVGVMPPGFDFPAGAELWTSLRFTPGMLTPDERGDRYLRVVGRVREGISGQRLTTALASLLPRFRAEHPSYYEDPGVLLTATALRDDLLGDVRPALLALLAGVILVFLVTIANLSNVSLVRTAERDREFAVRASLGATRTRLAAQLAAESALLGLFGGLGGALLGSWATSLLARLAPPNVPRLQTIRPNAALFALTILVACLASLLAGALPMVVGGLRRSRKALSLQPGAGESRATHRTRSVLVAGQIALTLVLVSAAGLVLHSLERLSQVRLGLDPSHTLTMRIGLPESTYPEASDVSDFYQRLLDRIRALPAVRSAAATAILPLSNGGWEVSFDLEGRRRVPGAPQPAVQYRPVTPGFFDSLHIPLIRGRVFSPDDNLKTPLVAIANQAFVRRFLAGEEALSGRIDLPGLGVPVKEHIRDIVGIVGDVRESPAHQAPPILYVPHAQQPERSMTLVVRSDRDPESLISSVRRQVARLDPSLPLYEVRSMREVVDSQLKRHRFVSALLALFSLAGLALAVVGIWAVVAYGVARRTREVGIRLALGASPRALVAKVTSRGVAPVLLGALAGLLTVYPASLFISALIFGIGPHDAETLATATASVVIAGALATWLPARRAARIDPVEALRHE